MNIAMQKKVDPATPVRATINYSVWKGRRPVLGTRGNPSDMSLAPAEMPIFDAATFATAPTLDAEGFAKVPHKIDISDLAKSEQAQNRYLDDLAPFVRQVTGADEVRVKRQVFVRHQAPRAPGDATPVDFAHADFTEAWMRQVLGSRYFDPPSRPDIKRCALYNVWMLLSRGPTNRPLALCDARSLAPEDLIVGEAHHDMIFEIVFLGHNPNHRWVYFSDLTSSEMLVFKQSDTDPAHRRVVPHTAVDIGSYMPPGLEPRISIESRCQAIWYD